LLEEPEIEVSSFRSALKSALEELKKMRIEEGRSLVDDITGRMQFLDNRIEFIENKRAEIVKNSRAMLSERLKALFDNVLIDDTRIVQEAAILVERSDITEEIVRIKSHLKHMKNVLKQGGIIGKKVDFLGQELHRELNTLGSKAGNTEISAVMIDMKHEIEKIREQTQNLQ
jgi:uncharacterized protein (TIGR00255 family)